MKDMPPLRECGRDTDAGTEVEGHARGSQGARKPERGNQPEKPDNACRPKPVSCSRWTRNNCGMSNDRRPETRTPHVKLNLRSQPHPRPKPYPIDGRSEQGTAVRQPEKRIISMTIPSRIQEILAEMERDPALATELRERILGQEFSQVPQAVAQNQNLITHMMERQIQLSEQFANAPRTRV